jgi:hypothetical protein
MRYFLFAWLGAQTDSLDPKLELERVLDFLMHANENQKGPSKFLLETKAVNTLLCTHAHIMMKLANMSGSNLKDHHSSV